MAEGREMTADVIGVIGVGEIAEALVVGLLSDPAGAPGRVVLSPRGAARAAGLAARFDAVSVATSNAEVVEAADTVIVSVRSAPASWSSVPSPALTWPRCGTRWVAPTRRSPPSSAPCRCRRWHAVQG
ncbi:NAD(P)-binding domain-containing protein [Corynebacterium variabile]|uniref:NAD(P)-binding domain-containing protein n=1 Tax=Corynebacterium variabile TaxID=1727 RepID=UPI00289F8E32|nr:NAD(P)-binding domain-containing protein [Corynebacterium variabile]